MIRPEYLRFLETLKTDDVPVEVRKIANLVFQYLETLVPLSSKRGQRIKKIVELSLENWSQILDDIKSISDQTTSQKNPVTELKSLSVGPFRGFEKQEDFDLESRLVLIYGPNGTGKTSFCEALEYALLEKNTEAESKRFRNPQVYLKNAYTNSFTPPVLIGIDNQGNSIPISANESLYRFCFVEKNRIDNFSRIAAQVPAKQTELISTLFGLDLFTEFVRNFTDKMDKYIDIEGEKAKELVLKRQRLAVFQQQLVTIIPDEIKRIDTEENELAEQYREKCTFSQMVSELNGSDDKPGLILQLDDDLQKPVLVRSNLTTCELQTLKQSVETEIEELKTKQVELSKVSQQVLFKQLYEAIKHVKESSSEHCPACKTSLAQVKVNPFEHADVELKKLNFLGELQDEVNQLKEKLGTSLVRISQIIKTCCSCDSENNPLLSFQMADGKIPTVDWWISLHNQLDDGFTMWQRLESQIKQFEATDKMIDQTTLKRKEKQIELKRFREFAEKIVKLVTRRETANRTGDKAKKEIEKFDNENDQLIKEVESEKTTVAQNKTIASAYYQFVQKLNAYKNGLPELLVADLGDQVVTLYNAFNRNDANHEKLTEIRLPLSQNDRLEISFNKEPDIFYDALHILSEGHIRCIGLAILMAKNIKENCHFLIFDDPVNAIDDDHREAIRRTMFEDSYFANKQIILACHGEEFFKDVQNLLSVEVARQSKIFAFLPRTNDSNICVDHACSPRNYIIASRIHYDKNEIRDALGSSRRALESLTKGKVWNYVNKHGDGNLSIKLRSANAPIQLRNLTEQLKTKIDKLDFSDTNKIAVLNPIQSLLGVSGDSREWRYLNKGIHEEEDRAEFDRGTVNQIILALEQLDEVFK